MVGTERIISDGSGHDRIVDTGPVGRRGLPGLNGADGGDGPFLATMYIPPDFDIDLMGGAAALTAPNPAVIGVTIVVVGRGELNGIYEGRTDPDNPANPELWEIPEKLTKPIPDVFMASGILTNTILETGPIYGEWLISRNPPAGADVWKDPIDLSAPISGGGMLTTTMVIAAPAAFATGLDGAGNWPLDSTYSLVFTNQTNPSDDGVYRGATTDPESPVPLVRVSDLPEHTTFILSGIWVATNEMFTALAEGYPGGPLSEEVMLASLGPFLIAWVNDPFTETPGWLPLGPGWGAMVTILSEPRVDPVIITGARNQVSFGGTSLCNLEVPYDVAEVQPVGSAADPTINVTFANPGAHKVAAFRLWMNFDNPGTINLPAYVHGSSDTLTSNGHFDVVVVGQGTADTGDPALVTILQGV